MANSLEERTTVEERRVSKGRIYHSTGIVILSENSIVLKIGNVGEQAFSLMKPFAQEIMDRYSPRVFSEHEGDEWTDVCNGKIDIMFEYDTWAPRDKPE